MAFNRISRFTDQQFLPAGWPTSQPAVAESTSPVAVSFGGGGGAMVLIPGTVQAPWQAELYRLAYEKALVDTAPPQYVKRFSVWN